MGKIRVVEGTIQEIGRESVQEGEDYALSFLKIDGERILDIGCDKFIRSFIKPGVDIKLSIAKGVMSHEIAAVKLADGELLKASKVQLNIMAFQIYCLFLFILACGSYVLLYKSMWITYFVWVLGGAAIFTRLSIGYRYRARRALDIVR